MRKARRERATARILTEKRKDLGIRKNDYAWAWGVECALEDIECGEMHEVRDIVATLCLNQSPEAFYEDLGRYDVSTAGRTDTSDIVDRIQEVAKNVLLGTLPAGYQHFVEDPDKCAEVMQAVAKELIEGRSPFVEEALRLFSDDEDTLRTLVQDLTSAMQEAKKEAIEEAQKEEPDFDRAELKGELLDYHPAAQLQVDAGTEKQEVKEEDATWVYHHFEIANSLSDETKFHLAIQSLNDSRYSKDLRIAVARLWTGIEALLDVRSELRYRIAVYCASLLTPPGSTRLARFKEVRKLYDRRSGAVHGGDLTDEQLANAFRDSFSLLSELLVLTIERGRILTTADFDAAIFGAE